MKDGDKIVTKWNRILKNMNELERIASSVELSSVQDWLYWREYKDAYRN